MTLRYLFGPVSADFASQHLWKERERRECLVFNASGDADVSLEEEGNWQSLKEQLPHGWRPDFVALYLPYTSVPSWLWDAPVPVVALPADWNLLWHYYRFCLGQADLVLTDAAGLDALRQEGVTAVASGQLYGAGRRYVDYSWPDGERDIDILYVGYLNQAIHRERLPCLARVAKLSHRYHVVIEQGVFGEEYCELLGRAKIVFNRTIRRECNRRVWEAVAAGALLFVEEENGEVPHFLEDRRECVYFNDRNLEELLEYYLKHDEEREEIARAARQKIGDCSFSAFWQKTLQQIEADWPDLVERRSGRQPLGNEEKLMARTWQILSGSAEEDVTLVRDMAAVVAEKPDPGHWLNTLALVSARREQGNRNLTSSILQTATAAFRRAVEADAKHVMARLNLAEALFLSEAREEAIQECRAILDLLEGAEEVDPLVWQSGHFPIAYDLFRVEWEKAAWQNAEDRKGEVQAKEKLLRWRCHTLLAELTGKVEHFYEAVLARPDLPSAQAGLGCALARSGQLAEAIPHLRQAVAGNPFDTAAARALCQLFDATGKHRQRRRLLSEQRRLSQAVPKLVPPEAWFAPQPPQSDELASIIILCCNELEFTRRCLESLLVHTRPPYEVILIDNGSTDGTLTYLKQIQKWPGPQRVVVIHNDKNLGFAKGCNQGMAQAEGEFLVLLNNDTILTQGWLQGLVRWSLKDWPQNGLVGAVSNYAAPPQQIDVPYRTVDEMQRFAQERRRQYAGQAITTERLLGFCMLLRRDVLERIGTLDERYGLGFFEDDDWGIRAREAGYRLIVAQEVFIHHFGSRTFRGLGIDAYQQLDDNFTLFEEKWGKQYTQGYHLPQKMPQVTAVHQLEGPATNEGADESSTQVVDTRPKVSICMIVKNEEKHLGECLKCIADLIEDQEIVIVDSGSTDRTKQIAEEFGAKVVDFTWVDSFAAARNEGLRHAKGEWILWFDADERLDDTNRQRLQSLLRNLPKGDIAFIMRQSSPLESNSHATVYVDQVRLFRSHPEIRWQYRAHEQILPSLRSVGAEIAPTNIVIEHLGFSHAPEQEQKVDRNLRLLEMELQENPEDAFVLYNVGTVYLGRNELDKALHYLQKSLDHSQPSDTLVPKLFSLLVRIHHQRGEKDIALQICERGKRLSPHPAELLFWEGVLRKEKGDLRGCEQCLVEILQLPRAVQFASADEGLHGYRTRHLLAEVYLQQKRAAEAEAQWCKAVEEAPRFTPAWWQLGQLWLEQQRWRELPSAIERLQQDPAMAAEASVLQGRAMLAREEYLAARKSVEEALERHPKSLSLRILHSHVLLKQGSDLAAAEMALGAILQIDPNHGETKYNLERLQQQRLVVEETQQGDENVGQHSNAAGQSQTISLCMIVRNEEDNLPDCLASVADLVHEMIVVDTGSTDRTREIAQQAGAKVFDFPWVDSFAAARNECLRYATADWIFWMDADDRLDEVNRQKLHQLFGELQDDNAAYVMKCLCLPDPKNKTATQVDHVRLFRNDPALRWRYRVHEQILPAIRQRGGDIRWSDVVIHHIGYQEPELRARKLERDLRLLHREMEEQPDDPFTLFNLGCVYREQGKLDKAIPLFRRSLDGSQPTDSIVRKLYVLLAQSYRQAGQMESAVAILREGRSLFPSDIELLFQEGVAYRAQGEVSRAIESWQQALNTDPGAHFASVDVGLKGYLTHQNLAAAYAELKTHDKAEQHWRAALQEKPDYEPAHVGLAELYLGQQRWEDFERLLEEWRNIPSLQVEGAVMGAKMHIARQEFGHAITLLRETVANHPEILQPKVVLSHAFLQQGEDWQAAEEALRDVLAQDPQHAETRHNLKVLLEQQGKTGDTIPRPTSATRGDAPERNSGDSAQAAILMHLDVQEDVPNMSNGSTAVSKIMISLCNKPADQQHGPNGSLLWEYDVRSDSLQPLQFRSGSLPPALGVTGLAHYRDGIVAVLQSNPVLIVYWDRNNCVRKIWPLHLVRDGHSIAVRGDSLYIASTGSDAVIEFQPDKGERVFWQSADASTDTIHLNSLVWHQDRLWASAFGQKEGRLWRTADKGFVMDLIEHRHITNTLYHPHSLVSRSDGLYFCESSRMAVGRGDGQRLHVGEGYSRGLIVSDDCVVVGLSEGRKRSRSTGELIDNSADLGLAAGRCGLVIYDYHGDLSSSKRRRFVDLEQIGSEIYDLLLLDDN